MLCDNAVVRLPPPWFWTVDPQITRKRWLFHYTARDHQSLIIWVERYLAYVTAASFPGLRFDPLSHSSPLFSSFSPCSGLLLSRDILLSPVMFTFSLLCPPPPHLPYRANCSIFIYFYPQTFIGLFYLTFSCLCASTLSFSSCPVLFMLHFTLSLLSPILKAPPFHLVSSIFFLALASYPRQVLIFFTLFLYVRFHYPYRSFLHRCCILDNLVLPIRS